MARARGGPGGGVPPTRGGGGPGGHGGGTPPPAGGGTPPPANPAPRTPPDWNSWYTRLIAASDRLPEFNHIPEYIRTDTDPEMRATAALTWIENELHIGGTEINEGNFESRCREAIRRLTIWTHTPPPSGGGGTPAHPTNPHNPPPGGGNAPAAPVKKSWFCENIAIPFWTGKTK